MWYSHENLGWVGWTLMITSMVVFWGLMMWGIWAVVRLVPSGDKVPINRSPEQWLAHRFATGEIDADAYRQALDVMAGRDDHVVTGSLR